MNSKIKVLVTKEYYVIIVSIFLVHYGDTNTVLRILYDGLNMISCTSSNNPKNMLKIPLGMCSHKQADSSRKQKTNINPIYGTHSATRGTLEIMLFVRLTPESYRQTHIGPSSKVTPLCVC